LIARSLWKLSLARICSPTVMASIGLLASSSSHIAAKIAACAG
jgi:hypothetical protein